MSETKATALLCGVPDGWQLVPQEPVRAMTLRACDFMPCCEHIFGHGGEIAANVYRGMLEAAPDSDTQPAPADALREQFKARCCVDIPGDDPVIDALLQAARLILTAIKRPANDDVVIRLAAHWYDMRGLVAIGGTVEMMPAHTHPDERAGSSGRGDAVKPATRYVEGMEAAAKIAECWRVSEISNGDLTDEQLHDLLNGIGLNIAAAIREEK